MGYDKNKRPMKAPSFTPNPTGIALADLAQGTNGQLPIAQTSGSTTYRTVTGEVTITSTGVTALADGLIHQATVTLTNAQLKALRAAPFELVAAPGVGKMLKYVGSVLLLKAGANVLTESTANLAVKYTNGSGAQASQTIEATGFIDQAADTLTNGEPKIDVIVAKTAADNANLVLHNLGAGEFGGNAALDATLKVTTVYRIVPTT